jgi:RNA polymerase sigma-70 factor, ECF subfamily
VWRALIEQPEREAIPGEWFELLVRRLEVPAYKLAMLLTKDADLAQEVVQEAFVRAWQSAKTPRDTLGFRRWLYRIIVNLVRDEQRRRRRLAAEAPSIVATDPSTEVDRRFALAELASAFAQLSPRQQQVLYLRFFSDLSYAELAHVVGTPQLALRVGVHRSLRKLRSLMEAGKADG